MLREAAAAAATQQEEDLSTLAYLSLLLPFSFAKILNSDYTTNRANAGKYKRENISLRFKYKYTYGDMEIEPSFFNI